MPIWGPDPTPIDIHTGSDDNAVNRTAKCAAGNCERQRRACDTRQNSRALTRGARGKGRRQPAGKPRRLGQRHTGKQVMKPHLLIARRRAIHDMVAT